jgi:hypothetical protein
MNEMSPIRVDHRGIRQANLRNNPVLQSLAHGCQHACTAQLDIADPGAAFQLFDTDTALPLIFAVVLLVMRSTQEMSTPSFPLPPPPHPASYEGLLTFLQLVFQNQVQQSIPPGQSFYMGGTLNGSKYGFAADVTANGIYLGHFVGGLRCGAGQLRSSTGTVIYEGEWKADKQHGRGKRYYAGGAVHEGEFKNGVRDGPGTFTTSATVFQGTWSNDEPHGPLSLDKNGKLHFVGAFKGLNADGYGTMYSATMATKELKDIGGKARQRVHTRYIVQMEAPSTWRW